MAAGIDTRRARSCRSRGGGGGCKLQTTYQARVFDNRSGQRIRGVELSTDEAERIVPFIADAIAVAMGYGAHPRGDVQRSPERAPYPRPERVVDVVLPPR